jgi:hypothetical protein
MGEKLCYIMRCVALGPTAHEREGGVLLTWVGQNRRLWTYFYESMLTTFVVSVFTIVLSYPKASSREINIEKTTGHT